MQKLYQFVFDYNKKYFHWQLYTIVVVFLAVAIYFNYSYNFERGFLLSLPNKFLRGLGFSVVLAIPFLFTCVLLHYFKLQQTWWRQRDFWLLLTLTLVLYGLSRTVNMRDLLGLDADYLRHRFIFLCFVYIGKVILIILPLVVYYYYYERKNDSTNSWFGLSLKGANISSYTWLVICIVLYMSVTSYITDLTAYYPVLNRSGALQYAQAYKVPYWQTATIFETLYALNFISVEFLFRGVLVIGFVRFLGPYAVLPMVGSYAVLHFGKPMTETITSVLGGYLTGIFAYYTNRIWGGVILHITLALSMEFFGLFRIYG